MLGAKRPSAYLEFPAAGPRKPPRPLTPLSFLVLAFLVLATGRQQRLTAQSADAETATIREMVSAGLPQAAVAYAQARMQAAEAESNPELAALWTQRAMEAASLAAMYEPDQAPQFDAQAQTFYQDFRTAFPDQRRTPWLNWQRSRGDLLRGQSLMAVYLAAPGDTAPREKALVLIRDIQTATDQLLQDLRKRLIVASRESLRGGSEAPADQLMQLRFDTDLLLSEALLLRSQAYAVGSQDHQAAMGQLDNLADDSLQRAQLDWSGREKLELAKGIAGLELGRVEDSLNALRKLVVSGTSQTTRNTAAWTLVDFLCRNDKLSEARQFYAAIPPTAPLSALAGLKLQIAEANRLDASTRDSKTQEIVRASNKIRELHGDYWQNRADALITATSHGGANSPSAPLDLIQVQVKQLLAAGKTDEAIQKLHQRLAQDTLDENGQSAVAVSLQVSALEFREQRLVDSVASATATSLRFPSAARSAALHRFALAVAQAALAKDIQNKSLATQYSSALEKHLATWPNSPTAEDAAQWLMRWRLGQREFTPLLTALLEYATATTSAQQSALWRWTEVYCLTPDSQRPTALEALKQSNLPAAKPLAAFLDNLDNWHEDGTRAKAITTLGQYAEIVDTPNATEQPAGSAGKQPGKGIPWMSLLRSARSLESARQMDITRATDVSPALRAMPSALITFFLRRLVEAIDLGDEAQRRSWAIACHLDAEIANICIESKRLIDQATGYRLIAWANEDSLAAETVTNLLALRKKAPREGELMLQLAELLSERPAMLEQSNRWARTVAAGTPGQSVLHLRGQYRRIGNMVLAGKTADARQAAKLFLATSPPTDVVWRKRFEQLAGQ